MKAISKEEFILSQIFEEALPIPDGKKRAIHQRVFRFGEGLE